jgi:murein DD-endopeptidase MepM/ murein hydrolase activator NlpD
MQNPAQLGNMVTAQMDALAKSGERFESQVRAAQKSGKDQPEALRKVAQEFESLFISYLLKVMRETIEESGLTEGGFGKGIYTDLFDQELSRKVAQTGGLGISDMIYRRLGPEAAKSETSKLVPATNFDEERLDPEEDKPDHLEKSELVPGTNFGRSGSQGIDIPDNFLPVSAPVSSSFGLRRDPIDGKVRFHNGLDLAAPAGTAVLVPWGGKVVSAGFEKGYGNFVVIEHPEGFQTRYAHLGASLVKKGDIVADGDELGTVGSTGRSTGPHLHFEVIKNGELVDPRAALAD